MGAFLLELKGVCKSHKLLALVLILILLQLVMFQQALDDGRIQETTRVANLKNTNLGESRLRTLDTYWEEGILATSQEHYDEARQFYQHMSAVEESRYQAYIAGDWPAYSRGEAQWRIFGWQYEWRNFTPTPQEFFGDAWPEIQAKLELPEYNMDHTPLASGRLDGKGIRTTSSFYYLALMDTGLPPYSPNSTEPWAFLFNFLRTGLPTLLGIIVLLLTVNLLHRDRDSGVIKTQLATPRSRWRYLLRKLALGAGASIVALVLALFPMGILLGIRHGFRGLSHPVLLDKYSLVHATVHPNRVEAPGLWEIGLNQMPLNVKPEYLEHQEFIPLWQFLALAAAMLLLFILFCTVLGLLISILVKNEVVAHVVAGLVFVAGTALGTAFPQLSTSPWDFFARADVVPLLEGNQAATYLAGIAALMGATILLFSVATMIFRRQDISSN